MADPAPNPPQCGNCRHVHTTSVLDGGHMQCWRHPPTAHLANTPNGPIGVTVRPGVTAETTCGDHDWTDEEWQRRYAASSMRRRRKPTVN